MSKLSDQIKEDYYNLRTAYTGAFRSLISICNGYDSYELGCNEEKDRRKYFAMLASKYTYSSLLFMLYDGKINKFEEKVWDIVKPKLSVFRKGGTVKIIRCDICGLFYNGNENKECPYCDYSSHPVLARVPTFRIEGYYDAEEPRYIR